LQRVCQALLFDLPRLFEKSLFHGKEKSHCV